MSMLTKGNNLKGVSLKGEETRREIQCSEILVEKAIKENWIKELAMIFLIKNRFRNSILFNYERRQSEISRRLNVSPNTLRVYINALLKQELVYWHKNNLVVRSVHKIKKKFAERWACTLTLSKEAKLKDVEYRLYLKKLHILSRQQVNKAKAALNDHRELGISDANLEPPFFGYRALAKELNCSVKKISTLMTYLSEKNLIQTKVISKDYGESPIKKIEYKHYQGWGWPYVNRKGNLIVVYGTHIKFLDYPIAPIGRHQYSKPIKFNLKKANDDGII